MDELRNELLREVYYNPRTGFRSIDETLRQARALNNDRQARAQRLRQPYTSVRVDREDVKRFLESQEVRQQTVRRRREGSYVATAAREEFECDLAEFGEGFGGGVRYALVCVDVFSKKCAAVAMSDKRSQTTADALRQCFSELGVPVRVYTDEGSEFQNSTVESLLTSLNVALVTTRGYANFVERMIRTLKERLRIRHLTFGEPWDKLLPDVVKQYNDQAHSATRMAPKLAALDENNDTVRARLQKRAKPSRRPPLAVGDIVRIARPHTAGRRVRDVQFGAEAYPVQEIVHEGGVKRYRVNERLYLRHDLLKIDDIRAPSGQSRILGEDDQPLVPRVSRAMQQQYSRDVNRRLALERMTGDVATFVYAQDEDDAPLSNLAQAAQAPRVPPVLCATTTTHRWLAPRRRRLLRATTTTRRWLASRRRRLPRLMTMRRWLASRRRRLLPSLSCLFLPSLQRLFVPSLPRLLLPPNLLPSLPYPLRQASSRPARSPRRSPSKRRPSPEGPPPPETASSCRHQRQ